VINVANRVHGLQFGLFNYAERLDGMQIGALNIATENHWFNAFPQQFAAAIPIVNWSF
jgi:hypothetical protein